MNYKTTVNVSERGIFFSEFIEPRMGEVYNALTNKLPMNFDRPLNMEYDMNSNLDQDHPLDIDLQVWSSNMMLGGGTIPTAFVAIISEKVWDIIKDLRLPPNYNLVPVRLMYNSQVRLFYMFHIYSDVKDYIDLDNCIYEDRIYDRIKGETTVIKRFKGGFNTREESRYGKYSDDMLAVEMRMEVLTALAENFDLFWGINNLKFNSKTKGIFQKHIDDGDLYGISMLQQGFNIPNYICPEDYHLLDQGLDELLDNLS